MDALRNPLPTMTARERTLGAFYLVFQVFFLSSILYSLNALLRRPLGAGLINFLYFSVNCIATLCIFSRFLQKNLLRVGRFPKEILLYVLLGFGLYWLCSSVLGLAVRKIFPDYVNLNDRSLQDLLDESPVFMCIGTVFLAPVAEELLHRGLVFGTLYSKNAPAAYALSAVLFAAIHIIGYIGTYSPAFLLLALVQYLPAGLIFAWSYRRSGSIFTPIAIHILNNAVLVLTSR